MTSTTMDMLLSPSYPVTGGHPPASADSLFALVRKQARKRQIWSKLTGHSGGLLALKEVRAACTILARSDGGVRPVPIRQIRGSEGRSGYFDRDFNPLYDRARGRWVNIARARQQGQPLPPVVLVRVGDIYFVKDGHHRVSVARALGQREIEARVTGWEVAGPLPWEADALAPNPGLAGQLLGIGRALKKRGFPKFLVNPAR